MFLCSIATSTSSQQKLVINDFFQEAEEVKETHTHMQVFNAMIIIQPTRQCFLSIVFLTLLDLLLKQSEVAIKRTDPIMYSSSLMPMLFLPRLMRPDIWGQLEALMIDAKDI